MEGEIKTLKALRKAYFSLLGLITKKGIKNPGELIIFSRKDLLKVEKIHDKLARDLKVY